MDLLIEYQGRNVKSPISMAAKSARKRAQASGGKAIRMLLLKTLEKGVDNKKHIDKDTDLDSLRKDEEYGRLMKKYFGSEAESQRV
jgi:hypothetical protein